MERKLIIECAALISLRLRCATRQGGRQKSQILTYSISGLGGGLQGYHAWAHLLDNTVRGMPIEFNRWAVVTGTWIAGVCLSNVSRPYKSLRSVISLQHLII